MLPLFTHNNLHTVIVSFLVIKVWHVLNTTGPCWCKTKHAKGKADMSETFFLNKNSVVLADRTAMIPSSFCDAVHYG